MQDKFLNIKDKIAELVDSLEEYYGDLEGFEVKLAKQKDEDGNVTFSVLEEVNIYYFKHIH